MIAIAKFLSKHLRLRIERLLRPKSLYMSQAGQDFWVFGEAFNEGRRKYFLDIGAHDGIALSNTYLLERRYGWNGICVEANPDTFETLKENRRVKCVNMCLDSTEGLVNFAKKGVFGGIVSATTDNKEAVSDEIIQIKTQTLRNLLKEWGAPQKIDYLSIDVEGAEERILGNFDFKEYQFNCITIERPTSALRKIFDENGYIIIKEIPGLDCFYVHKEFLPKYRSNLYAFYKKKYLTMRWK